MIKIGDANLAVIAENRLSTGHVHSESIAKIIRPFTQIPPDERPDTVVLGCTHYPFVKDVLQTLMPGVNLIDSGEAIGRRVKDVIANLPFLEVDKKNNKAMYTGILTSYEERLNMVRSFGFNDLEKF